MRYIGVFILFLLLSQSCNLHKREDAQKLANDMASISDSLNYYGKVWGDEFQAAVKTRDFTHLPPLRAEIDDYINRKNISVQAMDDISGSGKLREAALNFLKYEKEIVIPRMSAFETFDSTTPDDNIKAAFNAMIATSKEDIARRDTVSMRLDEYAEKNDFPKVLTH
jgi:hypothetical protein